MKKLPYISIDNFLTEAQIRSIRKEISDNKMNFIDFSNPERVINFHRWYIDESYNNRSESHILTIFGKELWNDRVQDAMSKSRNDLSFALHNLSDKHETQVTSYLDGNEFEWHNDHHFANFWTGRIENWIYYLNDNVEGGELEIEDDQIYTLKPVYNRLIIMPSYLKHRVKKVKTNQTKVMNGRLTINGHVGFINFNNSFMNHNRYI